MNVPKNWPVAAGLLLALAICSFAWPGAAQDSKLPFSSGEKLRYAVQWRLVPAGDAELVLARDDTAPGRWRATAKANSIGYVSNIFKVLDEYQSSFRGPALCSSEIRKVINEGERHRNVTVQYDQRRKLAIFNDRDASGNTPPRQVQSAIPDCVHDILSALYSVRTQTLPLGQAIEVPVNDGTKTVRVRVEVQAKEEIKTPLGSFHSTRLEPVLFSGNIFKEKGRIFVWLSDDARHLPVQLKVQIGIGTITATLVAVERSEGNP